MMGRWKLHDFLFKGPDTYQFKLKTKEGEVVLPLVVDEHGYFHLDETAPAGFYAFAKFVG